MTAASRQELASMRGRGPLADQDDELNTLVAAVVFD
jgi:hypothetical protein